MDPAITDSEPSSVPAEGQQPDGPSFAPADRSVYGEGLARVLDALAERMPKAEVETVWSFPGVRREGREHGVAVISRRRAGERHLIYRARYVVQEKGQERGKVTVEIEETAEAPHELLPRVIAGVRDRADEAGDADVVDLGPWKSDDGQRAQ